MLYCKGGCKKNYVHDLELGSNKHWEVIAEADDRDKQQENVIESDDGDGNFEFEMDISSLCLLLSRHTKDPLHQVLASVPIGSLHPFFRKPHSQSALHLLKMATIYWTEWLSERTLYKL